MVVQVQPDQSARVAELRAQIDAVRSRKAALVARISRLEQQLMTKDIGDPLANVAQESGALAAEGTAPHIPQTEGFWKDTQAPGPLGVITQKLRGNPSDFSPADIAIATPTILAGMGPEAQKFYANVVRGLASAPTGMLAMIESNPLPGLIEWVERMAKTTAGAFEMASTGIPSPNNQAAIDETKKALYEAPVEEIGMILGLIGGLKGGAKLISKGVKPHVDIPDLQPEGSYTPGQAKSLIQEQAAHTRQAPDMPEVKPPDLGTLNNWRDELVQLGYDPARVAAMDRLEMEFYLTGGRSGRLPAPKPKPAPKIESAEAPRPVEPPIEQKPLDVPTERPKVVEPSKAPIVQVQPKTAQTEMVIPPPETRPTPPPVRPEQVAPVSPETVPPRPIEPPAPPPEPPKPVEPPPKPPRTEPVSQTEIQAVLDEMGPTDKAKYATELVQLTEKYARKPAQLDKELIAWYERAQRAPKAPPKPVDTETTPKNTQVEPQTGDQSPKTGDQSPQTGQILPESGQISPKPKPSRIKTEIETGKVTQDDQYKMGRAGYIETDGTISAVHVTDDPSRVMEQLKTGADPGESYGTDRFADLGNGLYVSDVPQMWAGRSRAKWEAIKNATDEQLKALVDEIAKNPILRDRNYLSESEMKQAMDILRGVRSGKMESNALTLLADQPYNLTEITSPEFLKNAGIEQTKQPVEVPVRLKGKFAGVEGMLSQEEAAQLRAQGYDGAYTKGGMSDTPQLVVWNKDAIESFGEYRKGQATPKVEPQISTEPAKPQTPQTITEGVGQRSKAKEPLVLVHFTPAENKPLIMSGGFNLKSFGKTSKEYGYKFEQDPRGISFIQATEPANIENWSKLRGRPSDAIYAEANFNKPLDIPAFSDDGISWKEALHKKYSTNGDGKKLTQSLIKDGYDAVITRHKGGEIAEVVALDAKKIKPLADYPSNSRAGKISTEPTPKLTYEEWEKQYRSAFNEMNKYTPDEVGSSHFAEQMAKLADDYPEYVERLEKSQEPAPKPTPKPTEPQAGELTKFKVGDEVDFMVLGKEKTGVITGVEKVGNEFNDRTESVVLVKDADGIIHRQSEVDLLPREAPVGKTDLAPSIAPETAPLETKFNRLGEVPRSKIYTDESRFQNRDKGKVAEESRQNVRENFDPNNFDPIVVWEDPKRPGEHVVLSGHSRLAGLDDRGHKGNIPVRFFEGTEEQAIQYAREYANRSGTKESLSADVRAYQSMVDRGATQKEIQATFKSQSKFLDAIRHLDPNGKFMEIMGQDNVEVGFTDIKKFARWIGELRKDYPDKFTNRHEKQLFEHFYVDDNKGKNRQILKEDFDNLVARQITDFDWNPNGPLILERGQEVITGTKARFDTRAAEARIEELKERWREAETLGEKEALAAQIDKLRQRIKEAVRDQTDMFGMLGDPDAPMGAGRSKRTSEAHQMDPAQERVAKDQIIRFFEKSLGIPIRTGRFNQRAHGIFKPMVDVIRSRVWGNLPTITHEIGHFLEETKFGGFGPNSRLPQFPDLYQLGYDLYGRRKPHNGYYSEGFAEYLAHRMVGNNVAVIAPDFHPYFEQMLRNDPKLKKILAEGQEMTTRWFAQGAANRVRMMREHSSFADRLAQFRDRFSRDNFAKSLARFRDLWTQPEASIVLAESEMRGISAMDVMNPEKTRPTSSAGQQYRANAFAAQAQARSFVNHGVFDYNGKVTFPSLKEVLRPVARQIDNFWDYAISRYTLDLRKRGINSGVDPLDARYMVDKLESPEFRKALDDITEWQGQVLRYLVDAGGLSETAYQAIRDLNPIHVPLKRIIDLRKGVPGTGQKMGDIGSPVKTLKGSGRIIRDPLEAIIEQTAQIISTANRIRVGRALAELAEKSYGSGKWMERLPMPKRVTTFALEEISRELQKAGMDITDADLGQIASIYRNTRQGVPAENIITIWRDGDIQTWQLDKNLYSSLMNLDGVSQTMFLRFMSAPAKLKRMLITGLNPEFALTTNPIRDAFTFAAQTKYSKLAPLSAFEGFFRRFFPDEVNRLYNRSGADMGQIMQMDKHGLKEAVGEVLANTKMAQALNIAKHPVDILRELLSITESGPRRAEFKAAYKSLSKKYGEGADARIGATVASKDVTVDFSRMGKYAQYVNSLVPFFNAAIQGASKFGRTIKSNPIRSTAYGASMTAVSMAIWNEQKDEPWYRALPAWRKYGFWNIPVGTHEDGSVKIMSLPVPFEWGIVFKALPEAFLNAHYEKDPVAVKEFIQTVGTQTMPSLIPTAAQPIIEDQTNYDLFRNRQIVPQWMVESRVPEDQFFESTPQTYRELGERLGYSPAKLQHSVESLTGTFPTKVMRMIEGDTRSGQMEQLADLLVVGRLFPYQPNKEKREEADKESWERTKSRVTVLLGGGHYDEAKLAVEAWAFKHKDQEAKEVAIQLERIKSERASQITQRRQAAKLKK